MPVTLNPSQMISFSCQGILFDLDGTLVDSIAVVDRAWTKWATSHGLDPAAVLPQIHGRRSIDSIRALTPHLDVEAENVRMSIEEASDTEGVVPVPGALEFLAEIPAERWSIVTSGLSVVAKSRLTAVGIQPRVAIYGEDVTNGKPAPDPFLKAAGALGLEPSACIVFEDTAAGIRAGHAAGMKVIAVTSGARRPDLDIADAVISDYRSIRLSVSESQLVVDVVG